MTDTNAYPQTYRPWLSIAVLGGCLALIAGKLVFMLLSPATQPQAMRDMALFLPMAGLFGWYATNRFTLTADRFDNRYLWKHQVYNRGAIVNVEDVRSVRGRMSVVLMVREADGRTRPIYVSPPGKGGKAFAAWLGGLPGSEALAAAGN
ncbi:hypothetical protein ABI_34610 [Asticcacaulis biprosthecium C19]|uniref:PH domain-containing protein n=1 Tax=Asticcacaulis biprosthecium C19 TaxID=715226 RepID=F4QQF2_9CAUL|nr:hypothetical protein [Asticcacaulis biprosthecium]EGF90439.1 hypothetical protein ABI_34610 [Asticcacaulis biprosthecium C19]